MSDTIPCPHCGKPIDPLRAGQVAVLDGRFFYFCDAECKAAFLAGDANSFDSSAETREPPKVAASFPVQSRAALPIARSTRSTPVPKPVVSEVLGAAEPILTETEPPGAPEEIPREPSVRPAAERSPMRFAPVPLVVLLATSIVAVLAAAKHHPETSDAIALGVLGWLTFLGLSLFRKASKPRSANPYPHPILRWAPIASNLAVLPLALLAGATALSHGAIAATLVALAVALLWSIHGVDRTIADAAAGLVDSLGLRQLTMREQISLRVIQQVDLAVLPMRGVLLAGTPEVLLVESSSDLDPTQLLSLLAGIEGESAHPGSLAVRERAQSEGVQPASLVNIHESPGLGVSAQNSSGEILVAGSRAWLLDHRVGMASAEERVRELEGEGRSFLFLARGDRLLGFALLQDQLKSGARAAVARLERAGVEAVLVSGETESACALVAESVGIEHVRADMLASDRGRLVRELRGSGRTVAVFGHVGIDSDALAEADISIALGETGGRASVAITSATDSVDEAATAFVELRQGVRMVERAAVIALIILASTTLGLVLGMIPASFAPIFAALAGGTALTMTRAQ